MGLRFYRILTEPLFLLSLELPVAKVNSDGSAIALGYPAGVSGSILVVKALAELDRTNGRYGLITLCIGGGQGIALIIECIG